MASLTLDEKRSPMIRISGPVILITKGPRACGLVKSIKSPMPSAEASLCSGVPIMRPARARKPMISGGECEGGATVAPTLEEEGKDGIESLRQAEAWQRRLALPLEILPHIRQIEACIIWRGWRSSRSIEENEPTASHTGWKGALTKPGCSLLSMDLTRLSSAPHATFCTSTVGSLSSSINFLIITGTWGRRSTLLSAQ